MEERHNTGNKRIWSRVIALILAAVLIINTVISMQATVQFSAGDYTGTQAEHAANVTQEQTDYLSKGRVGRALTVLHTMLHKPKTYEEYEEYASIAIAREKYDEAAEYLKGCIDTFEGSDKDLAVLHLRLGSLYMLLEKQDQALESINSAIEKDAELSTAYLLRADIYQNNGEAAKAADDLYVYYGMEAGEPEDLMSLAVYYEEQQDFQKAVKCYSMGIDAAGDTYPEMYARRARCEILTNDSKTAGEDLERYFKLTDGDPDGQYAAMLGASRMEAGDYSGALEMFHRAIEDGYATPELLYSQAVSCAYAEQDYDTAIEDGLKAVEGYEKTGESSADVCYWVGMSYLAKKEYKDAAKYYKKAEKQDASIKDISYYRGICAMAQEQDEKAIGFFTKSIEKEESVTPSRYDRAICYIRLDRFEEGIADLEQVKEQKDDKDLAKQAEELLTQIQNAQQ